jgi:hypothetical protein
LRNFSMFALEGGREDVGFIVAIAAFHTSKSGLSCPQPFRKSSQSTPERM